MHREKNRNTAKIKIKHTIDINITTQMMVTITTIMVGKQWVKRWSMYRWAGEASIYVKKVNSNNGYEAEGKAFGTTFHSKNK